jgi:hypothetical protein
MLRKGGEVFGGLWQFDLSANADGYFYSAEVKILNACSRGKHLSVPHSVIVQQVMIFGKGDNQGGK